ncbi:MAG: hypothetical protein ACFCUX_01545 [Candidatus Methylacidiphilales bacterium]
MDPSDGTVAWGGKLWNIENNRLFRAQFESYLNTESDTLEADREYRELLKEMMRLLSTRQVSPSALDKAVDLLPKASSYPIDANLCDALASTIYNVWQAQNEQQRIDRSNRNLEREKELAEWNAQAGITTGLQRSPPANPEAAKVWQEEQQLRRDLNMVPYLKRAAELETMMLANRAKKELSEVQAKINFQILITQFFFQRRFEHTLLAIRFYQSIFTDGDSKLRVGGEMEKTFTETTGAPPTLAVIESLAQQAVSDVEKGVEAFGFLLDKKELNGATERLMEAFAIGQYLPVVRSLPREQKRRVLEYQQHRNRLLSALEVRDYGQAEELIQKLESMAGDFDSSKAQAVVQTAKTVSAMHLVKARASATSGDRTLLESELKAAAEIWPRNPALAEFTKEIFTQADAQQQAINELDRLIQTKNYREIFNNQMRYIAAVALYPEKQESLKTILEEMHHLQGTMMRAEELSSRGDHAGGWECLEMVIERFTYDREINQLRAELTTRASDFVRHLRRAQELEKDGQVGSSLAWYLNAQKIYPMSLLAREGIDRVVAHMVPTGPNFSDSLSTSQDVLR